MHKLASPILGIVAALSALICLFTSQSSGNSPVWATFAIAIAGLGIVDVLERIEGRLKELLDATPARPLPTATGTARRI